MEALLVSIASVSFLFLLIVSVIFLLIEASSLTHLSRESLLISLSLERLSSTSESLLSQPSITFGRVSRINDCFGKVLLLNSSKRALILMLEVLYPSCFSLKLSTISEKSYLNNFLRAFALSAGLASMILFAPWNENIRPSINPRSCSLIN